MSDLNIHSADFLKALKAHVSEKLTPLGLSLKWIAIYKAWIAVIDRMLVVVESQKPQQPQQ